MEKFLEEDASFMKSGSSWYVRIPPYMREFINIKVNANNEIIADTKIAMGLGKYGKFLFLFSKKQQREYQKRKQKEKQEGGE